MWQIITIVKHQGNREQAIGNTNYFSSFLIRAIIIIISSDYVSFSLFPKNKKYRYLRPLFFRFDFLVVVVLEETVSNLLV